MATKENIGYTTLTELTPQITSELAAGPQAISEKLLANGFISTAQHTLMRSDTKDDHSKAGELLKQVTSKVQLFPEKFHEFVGILDEELWLKDIAELIRERFDKHQKAQLKDKHSGYRMSLLINSSYDGEESSDTEHNKRGSRLSESDMREISADEGYQRRRHNTFSGHSSREGNKEDLQKFQKLQKCYTLDHHVQWSLFQQRMKFHQELDEAFQLHYAKKQEEALLHQLAVIRESLGLQSQSPPQNDQLAKVWESINQLQQRLPLRSQDAAQNCQENLQNPQQQIEALQHQLAEQQQLIKKLQQQQPKKHRKRCKLM